MYKTVVLGYSPVANKCAKEVEDEANKEEKEGFKLVSFSITNAARAILVFHKEDNENK